MAEKIDRPGETCCEDAILLCCSFAVGAGSDQRQQLPRHARASGSSAEGTCSARLPLLLCASPPDQPTSKWPSVSNTGALNQHQTLPRCGAFVRALRYARTVTALCVYDGLFRQSN